eukprot:GHVP01010062.1.p2 GENE.GHVP01010062.1~~GHVP01010062.1.p2  ORF type:complete len:203 (+),score=27.69 GHVP01010062.1:8-616(+)
MSSSKYIQELYKKKQSDVMRYILKLRCWEYRQRSEIETSSSSVRPEKARLLGYKKKLGYTICRVRIRRGGRKVNKKARAKGKPINHGIKKRKIKENLQALAEKKAGKFCSNLRLLNSYWVAEDPTYKYYESILIDPQHNSIRNNKEINWICNGKHKHRESRGLTSAGRKHRGIAKKNKDHNLIGGSRNACWKRKNTVRLVRA